jgi:hypothetical protein
MAPVGKTGAVMVSFPMGSERGQSVVVLGRGVDVELRGGVGNNMVLIYIIINPKRVCRRTLYVMIWLSSGLHLGS